MMKNPLSAGPSACFVFVAVLTGVVSGQTPAVRLSLSNVDPRWGERVAVTYVAPAESKFAAHMFSETLYCGVIERLYAGERMPATSGARRSSGRSETDSPSSRDAEIP